MIRNDKDLLRLFASRLRDLRLDLDKTQEEASLMCRLSLTYYRDLENGRRNPTFKILYKLAKGYNVTLEELFRGIK